MTHSNRRRKTDWNKSPESKLLKWTNWLNWTFRWAEPTQRKGIKRPNWPKLNPTNLSKRTEASRQNQTNWNESHSLRRRGRSYSRGFISYAEGLFSSCWLKLDSTHHCCSPPVGSLQVLPTDSEEEFDWWTEHLSIVQNEKNKTGIKGSNNFSCFC